MKISVFGLGYVGCISLGCLAKSGHQLIGVDTNKKNVELINRARATVFEKNIGKIIATEHKQGRISATTDHVSATLETDLSIVAVGTPLGKDGKLDLKDILDVARRIGEGIKGKKEFHIITIRSTISPGTCSLFEQIVESRSGKKSDRDFAVAVNPEFIREGTAVQDYFNPPFTLIGASNQRAIRMLSSLYHSLPAETIVTTKQTAEIIKYVSNAFHALKVSFANEIGNVCQALGVDSREVMDIICRDKKLNISPYYLSPGFAYGGSCLPKDLRALSTQAKELAMKTPLLASIESSNKNQLMRAACKIKKFGPRKLGFLGLSFKSGTDDLRGSPTIELMKIFIKREDCQIFAFDVNIQPDTLTASNEKYIRREIPHLKQLLVQGADDLVEKSDLIIVSAKENAYIKALGPVDKKTILDLAYLGKSFTEKKNYHGINW